MSGSLRLLPAATMTPPGKHDHVDLVLDNGVVFACVIRDVLARCSGAQSGVMQHALLAQLGPEPLMAGIYRDHCFTGGRGGGARALRKY